MADISLTIPDEQVERVAQAMGYHAVVGQDADGNDVPNDQSPAEYIKTELCDWMCARVKMQEIPTKVREYESTETAKLEKELGIQ